MNFQESEFMNIVGMLILGVLAGTLSGIFGIGGGIVIVPTLILIFGMHYHAATGTSLVALLLPVGILGAWQYLKSGKIGSPEIYSGLIIAAGILIGTYIGANLAISIPETYLRKGFAILLCLVAIRTWMS